MAVVPKKINSIVRVSEGPTGVFVFVCHSADVENLPTVGVETGSVALVTDNSKKFIYHEDYGWEEWS